MVRHKFHESTTPLVLLSNSNETTALLCLNTSRQHGAHGASIQNNLSLTLSRKSFINTERKKKNWDHLRVHPDMYHLLSLLFPPDYTVLTSSFSASKHCGVTENLRHFFTLLLSSSLYFSNLFFLKKTLSKRSNTIRTFPSLSSLGCL